jgi:hypothetical protein
MKIELTWAYFARNNEDLFSIGFTVNCGILDFLKNIPPDFALQYSGHGSIIHEFRGYETDAGIEKVKSMGDVVALFDSDNPGLSIMRLAWFLEDDMEFVVHPGGYVLRGSICKALIDVFELLLKAEFEHLRGIPAMAAGTCMPFDHENFSQTVPFDNCIKQLSSSDHTLKL